MNTDHDMASKLAAIFARRSSRRELFKFLGGSALGIGLGLTGTEVSAATLLSCSGCGGGPCNPCYAGNPTDCNDTSHPCADGCYGGCPSGCTAHEWWCCGPTGCKIRCSECDCSVFGFCCYCFIPTISRCGATMCPC